MPLYEYRCRKCGALFEKIQKFSDPVLTKCEECGGQIDRLISPPAIQFKGSGWYVTDYARKSGGDGGENKKTVTPSSSDSKKSTEPAPAGKPDKK